MEYSPISLSTLIPERELDFKIYIFFKERFLCYIDTEGKIPADKFEKLLTQKITKFYVNKEELGFYKSYVQKLATEATESNDATEVIGGIAESGSSAMIEDPGSQEAYEITQLAAASINKALANGGATLKSMIGKVVPSGDMIVKHCINVATYATKLAEEMGYKGQDLDAIATAALIHDVGISKIHKDDREIFFKPKDKLTPDDKRLYNIHCKEGLKLIKEKEYITKQILDLIEAHEEDRSGYGPMKKKKLEPLEEILSFVNRFDKLVTDNNLEMKPALKQFKISETGNYDLKLLKKFQAVLEKEGLL